MTALELRRTAQRMFEPPPEMRVSEWANTYRQLSPESSAEPGRFDMNRVPFMREIVDCYNDPEVEEWIVQKSSQVAFSENLNNVLGYIADRAPGPTMLLLPTLSLGKSYSKDRLAPMVRDNPCLASKMDSRSRKGDNTLLNKRFPGGYWQIVGANSPSELSSRPIRDLLVDEWDRLARSSGGKEKGEGSPDMLAEARQITFFNRKRIKGGTPTIKGASATERGFKSGDQRLYHVPCPRCSDHIPLLRERLDIDPSSANFGEYCCQTCEGWIKEHERFDMIRDAEAGGSARWTPHAESPAGIRSYKIWAAYSPFIGWRKIAEKWNTAKGDPEAEQVITNTLFGETYEYASVELDHEALFKQREDYDGQRLPNAVEVVTVGVDTQDDRFELEAVGWGMGEESWSIEFATIDGDPADASTREKLDRYLAESVFTREDGKQVTVSAAFIDSGGHRTDDVYSFARGKQFRHIYACKGSSTVGQPVFARFSAQKKSKIRLAIVGTDTAKEAIYARLAKGSESRGKMHFPLTYSREYFSGLTSEEKIVTWKSGTPRVEWKKRKGIDKARNEPLDVRVYALAALRSLPMASRRLRVTREYELKRPGKQAKPDAPQAPAPAEAPVEIPAAPRKQPVPAVKRATEARKRSRRAGWWAG